MKSRTPLIFAAVAGVALLSAAGVWATKLIGGPEQLAYETALVQLGNIEEVVNATGTLQPYELVEVSPQTGGPVVGVDVTLGQHVKKGQVVARIDTGRLGNQLRDRESQLQSQKANGMMFTANLENAERQLARQQKLKDGGFGSPQQYDQAMNRVKNERSNLNQFNGQIKTAEIQVQAARDELEKTNVRAPIDGLVAEIIARRGMILNNNQMTPTILKLANLDTMTVRTQVSEADIVKVRPGQKAYFTVLGDPDTRYEAILRSREVTPAGGTLDSSGVKGNPNAKGAIFYNALFEVDNSKGDLLPAMTAEVRIVLGEAKNVPLVPVSALEPGEADDIYYVKVVGADGKAVERKIQVGLRNDKVAQVKSGLKVGEKVVLGSPDKPKKGGLLEGLVAPPTQ